MINKRQNNAHAILFLIPLFGILLFILLYIISASIYPGGSNWDKTSQGYSLLHNYWCELLGDTAKNGEYSPSGKVAMPAMILLCASLAFFWCLVPHLFSTASYKKTIQISGIISMATVIFIFTSYHDLIINVAGFFGLIALTGTLIGLYNSKWYRLFWIGIFCGFLCLLNNFIYHTGLFTYWLPIVQKFSFFVFLFWIVWMDVILYSKLKLKPVQ